MLLRWRLTAFRNYLKTTCPAYFSESLTKAYIFPPARE